MTLMNQFVMLTSEVPELVLRRLLDFLGLDCLFYHLLSCLSSILVILTTTQQKACLLAPAVRTRRTALEPLQSVVPPAAATATDRGEAQSQAVDPGSSAMSGVWPSSSSGSQMPAFSLASSPGASERV
jgi:hypothetical protein